MRDTPRRSAVAKLHIISGIRRLYGADLGRKDPEPYDPVRAGARQTCVDYYYYEDEEPHRGRRRGHSVYAEPRDQYYYDDSDHHRGHRARSVGGTNWRQATEAAVGAGLIEGWRSRRDGDGVSRIATAAAGAAGTAMLVGRDDDRRNKRHVTEATLGGLMLDRVVNGRRKR
ncbi:hypothetical protein KJ359_007280 [Pestalotiopsis sp. 9143b]|nr:hypothetical protein KJ359_007280 [Pestalotiopsis sp. 9143b]